MTTHLDHIVSVKPKRSGGFTIRIKMPNGAGRITADAAVTTPEQAERVAVRIIDILARKKQESTHE